MTKSKPGFRIKSKVTKITRLVFLGILPTTSTTIIKIILGIISSQEHRLYLEVIIILIIKTVFLVGITTVCLATPTIAISSKTVVDYLEQATTIIPIIPITTIT